MSPALNPRIALTLCVALAAAVADATSLRVATFNSLSGIGAPGTTGHDALRDILARLDADVVALQEIRSNDLTGDPSPLDSLATTLGYPTIHLAETTGVLDNSNRVCFLSRHPLTASTNIAPPPGARDMARQISAIVVDVPGITDDPTILTLHLKCCLETDDPFRRAVELHRSRAYLQDNNLTAADPVIVLGDFNLIGSDQVYHTLPAGLPGSFVLGSDVSFPLRYFSGPAGFFSAIPLTALDARQLNGSDKTSGSSTIDFILATPALTSRPHGSEIYNSVLDLNNADGLPKAGSPLPAGTSNDASDHFALFADFELVNLPPLSLDLSSGSVAESDPGGTAVLTVTLPAAPEPGNEVVVTVSSSDPSEAVAALTMLIFPAGTASQQSDVIPQLDALLDGSQVVTFTAHAPGFSPATAALTVTDTNTTRFHFTDSGQTIVEGFDTFDGSADPARWPTSGGVWHGFDDGAGATPGNYAYGNDPSLGILLGSTPVSTSAEFRNESAVPISALAINYTAEQWRASHDGPPDRIVVTLLVEGIPVPLPLLTFTSDNTLPSGPLAGGVPSLRSALVSHLSIPPGESFRLRFTVTPGAEGGGAVPAGVFLNEIHYDNDGLDRGEFVEIAVGPGHTGSPSNLSVVFYNGDGGGTYSTHTLDTFTLDHTTASGHRLYSKLIPNLQNGSPDGLAIVEGSTVLQLLSYGGVIAATNGPAAGMTSTDIGVAQGDPLPAEGMDSLGLSGEGGEAADFAWTRFSGHPHTRGAVNPGQSFTSPAGSQGLAIDDVSVTNLTDTDLDGDPDLTDPDDDNDGLPDELEGTLGTSPILADTDGDGTGDGEEDADRDGQSNLAESLLTLTDPLDPNSRFTISIAPDPANPAGSVLSFPTLAGRTYTLERSHDLKLWHLLSNRAGDNTVQDLPAAGDPLESGNFFRVVVSLAP